MYLLKRETTKKQLIGCKLTLRHRAIPAPHAAAEFPEQPDLVDIVSLHEVHSQRQGETVEANDRKPHEGIRNE